MIQEKRASRPPCALHRQKWAVPSILVRASLWLSHDSLKSMGQGTPALLRSHVLNRENADHGQKQPPARQWAMGRLDDGT